MTDLYKPIPFYTVEAVNFAINYIDKQSDVSYKNIYDTALIWVRRVLVKSPCRSIETFTRDELAEAYKAAQLERENVKINKEITAAVVWLYIMTAVSDYAKTHKAAA